jgi:tripartite-type tricarboxylate transporter receptor subunit TctC
MAATYLGRGWTRRGVLMAASALAVRPARAQADFPSRPLTIVVPYGAGSSSDILARLLAPPMAEQLGYPVVVENRPGAGGTIGMGYVARSIPDGHTMALTSSSAGPINRALYRTLNFDPVRDFSLVYQTNFATNALIVAASSRFRSVGELVAAARAPGAEPLRYFSPGNGTSQHLSAVLLSQAAPGRMEHIPYRGPAEGLTGLLAGEIDFGFASLSSITGLLRDSRVRALGTTGPEPALPGVPTLAAEGFPRFAEVVVWTGIAVPRAVPLSARQRLHAAIAATLDLPTVRERFVQIGIERAAPKTLEETDAFAESQIALWETLVRDSGTRID